MEPRLVQVREERGVEGAALGWRGVRLSRAADGGDHARDRRRTLQVQREKIILWGPGMACAVG